MTYATPRRSDGIRLRGDDLSNIQNRLQGSSLETSARYTCQILFCVWR
jgi:hypothetical protein